MVLIRVISGKKIKYVFFGNPRTKYVFVNYISFDVNNEHFEKKLSQAAVVPVDYNFM